MEALKYGLKAKVAAGIGAIVLAATGSSVAFGATSSPSPLLVSLKADRSAPVNLAGSTLKSNAYIFLNRTKVASVSFYLDDQATPSSVELVAPYDFARTAASGAANPLDTTKLSKGTHRIRAVTTLTTSRVRTYSASFTVNNSTNTTSTSTTVRPTTTVAPTTTTTAPPVTVPPTPTTVRPTTTTTPPTTVPSTGALLGWQLNATNTGLAKFGLKCADLPLYTGGETVPAGTVISQKRIASDLLLNKGNITIDKSCIQPISHGKGMPVLSTQETNTFTMAQTKVTISNSEFDGSLLSQEEAGWATAVMGNADVKNNYIHGFGSGVALMNTGDQLSIEISGNYITDMVSWGDAATTGNHVDTFTIRDFDASKNAGRKAVVTNNRFDCDTNNCTGAFFIQTWAGNIDNVTISGNLLEGGGYQLGLETNSGNTYSNVKATNNRFTGTGWGATYTAGGPGWVQWSENYINNPSATGNKGAVVNP